MTATLVILLAGICVHTYAAELSQTCKAPGCAQQSDSLAEGKLDIDDAVSLSQLRVGVLSNRSLTSNRDSIDLFEPCKGDPKKACTKPGTWGPPQCVVPGYPCASDSDCCAFHCKDKETSSKKGRIYGTTIGEPCTWYSCQNAAIPHLKICKLNKKYKACGTGGGLLGGSDQMCFKANAHGLSDDGDLVKKIEEADGIGKETPFSTEAEAA